MLNQEINNTTTNYQHDCPMSVITEVVSPQVPQHQSSDDAITSTKTAYKVKYPFEVKEEDVATIETEQNFFEDNYSPAIGDSDEFITESMFLDKNKEELVIRTRNYIVKWQDEESKKIYLKCEKVKPKAIHKSKRTGHELIIFKHQRSVYKVKNSLRKYCSLVEICKDRRVVHGHYQKSPK